MVRHGCALMQAITTGLGGPPGILWRAQRLLRWNSFMTAIGLVGLPEGFVIGADGRMTRADETKEPSANDAEMETEEAQKIFTIVDADKTLVYAISGVITLDDFRILDDIKRKTGWLSERTFSS